MEVTRLGKTCRKTTTDTHVTVPSYWNNASPASISLSVVNKNSTIIWMYSNASSASISLSFVDTHVVGTVVPSYWNNASPTSISLSVVETHVMYRFGFPNYLIPNYLLIVYPLNNRLPARNMTTGRDINADNTSACSNYVRYMEQTKLSESTNLRTALTNEPTLTLRGKAVASPLPFSLVWGGLEAAPILLIPPFQHIHDPGLVWPSLQDSP
ncbi:hypothetical protein J6590_028162 [Homalodisca vitripennis]|nr:hypothetical protein J6590_028162 [Homalodisca vitripennis]